VQFTGNTSARSRALIRSYFPGIVLPRCDLYDKIVPYGEFAKKDIDIKNV